MTSASMLVLRGGAVHDSGSARFRDLVLRDALIHDGEAGDASIVDVSGCSVLPGFVDLQVNGAMDVAVEFTSLSKTFSMAGWRVGFAVGNERLLAALARVKSYLDYGAFTPVQVAAAAALNGPDDCIREMREVYRKRRDALVDSFSRAGWDFHAPNASMFAWVKIPEPFREMGSLEFSKILVEKASVAVAPGIGFGEHGDEYVRIALVENEQRIRQAARNVRRFLETAEKTLHNVVPLAARG